MTIPFLHMIRSINYVPFSDTLAYTAHTHTREQTKAKEPKAKASLEGPWSQRARRDL